MYLAFPDEAVDLSDPASIAAKCYSSESMEFKTLDEAQSYYFPGHLKPVIVGPDAIYEIDGRRWKRVAGKRSQAALCREHLVQRFENGANEVNIWRMT